MSNPPQRSTNLWQETPLIYSHSISNVLNAGAYLKLENLQPSHSFNFGGNAGLAAACAAFVLGVKCSVYIPEGVTQRTLDLLRREKASVTIVGRFYAQALEAATKLVREDRNAVMVPAYDDEVLWEGHSSMIDEISNQITEKPDAIFCSVGGGGLLGGIITGCKKVGWDDVPIIALETIGSDCFYHSMSLNGGRFNAIHKILPPGVELVHNDASDVNLAHFNGFTSKASGSLGASQPSAAVTKMALERKGGVKCVSVPDELSMQVLDLFAEDHKLLVELACSTTLVPAYKPSLFDHLVPATSSKPRTVVFIICGGFKITLADVVEYKQIVEFDIKTGEIEWDVMCDDGSTFSVRK
ncbi:tryptophan synthase beta subunit-like PLP-dependent enzyme [Infundibulicybe gibba]|nr:tryptophan synthase beta subunit-like PLP-dependent enzyme [Infundibulicybe gibba]